MQNKTKKKFSRRPGKDLPDAEVKFLFLFPFEKCNTPFCFKIFHHSERNQTFIVRVRMEVIFGEKGQL